MHSLCVSSPSPSRWQVYGSPRSCKYRRQRFAVMSAAARHCILNVLFGTWCARSNIIRSPASGARPSHPSHETTFLGSWSQISDAHIKYPEGTERSVQKTDAYTHTQNAPQWRKSDDRLSYSLSVSPLQPGEDFFIFFLFALSLYLLTACIPFAYMQV